MIGLLRREGGMRVMVASLVYWALLITVGLGSAIPAIWRATHAPDGTSNISVSAGNQGISLVVSIVGQSTWTGSIRLITLALLIAVPPLAMWFGWLGRKRAEGDVAPTTR
jgi:drug/metabolite transporter (DMT)-like permease